MLRVLLVDDSSFMRKELSSILESDSHITVIDTAKDGFEAVEKSKQLEPDVIIMDIEMPKMDGIEAVKRIRSTQTTPILLLSGVNKVGAGRVLDGLHAGAADFLPKKLDGPKGYDEFADLFRKRVDSLVESKTEFAPLSFHITHPSLNTTADTLKRVSHHDYQIVVIAASTGGPVAIEKVLGKLPANFDLPIIIVQHMPATFTEAFAERLNSLCHIQVEHAQDEQQLLPGHAYIAPGGKQLTLSKSGDQHRIKVFTVTDQHFNPCVDVTFESIAGLFHSNALAIVLTGMGSDGLIGAKLLKREGATLWAQDKATSVIYGMPMVIAENKLADKILPLEAIGNELAAA